MLRRSNDLKYADRLFSEEDHTAAGEDCILALFCSRELRFPTWFPIQPTKNRKLKGSVSLVDIYFNLCYHV